MRPRAKTDENHGRTLFVPTQTAIFLCNMTINLRSTLFIIKGDYKIMSIIKPERKQYSIVLVGAFNPLMFQPEWFGRNGVIPLEELEIARNSDNVLQTIITPQLTQFRISQLSITVEQNRFQIIAEKEPLLTIKDFAVKTFENLGGLPINAYGFNYSAHYQFNSASDIHTFADKLTPKQYWSSFLGKNVTGDDRKGGLSSLQMYQVKENNKGQTSIVLQKSIYFTHGIFLNSNDHTNIDPDDSAAEIVMGEIEKDFDISFANMANIQEDLITEATKDE